ncbi:MAG TPA: CHASE3 domain-containing protein [Methyloceanibacter sp.]|nr:CHASE3 domain-containing protein [Methyloceanibacter sp.]
MIFVGLALVAAAVVAVALLVVRSSEADYWLAHTVKVQQAGEALLSEIQLAESAKRGYLLTRDSDYLNEFNQSSGAIPRLVEELSVLVADNSDQALRLETLRPLVETKLTEMDDTLELDQRGERTQALETIKSARAEGLSKSIRDELFVFLNAERELLNMRQENASTLRRWLAALIGVALFTAMTLAILLAIATRHAVSDLIARTRELEEESLRRQEAEDSLHQVQKMEAVGQLSGGIAHDFNNLLTIIMGNLDTIKRRVATGPKGLAAKLEKPVDAALYGARSAAQLTQRLLAFSRRQALEPDRVDMNRLVTDMVDLLKRSLGEQISAETVLGAGLWPTFVDPNQLENALLNLALNARAAMPEGGCLTIETANTYLDDAYARRFGDIEPGQYVVLCVTDTGTGIPADVIDHVFEPFFSTKSAGEGSGLGLSMVHGFVKQSGGHVRIYSEELQGTTVKLYLPRMTADEEQRAAPAAKAEEVPPPPRAQPQETILLVEDNDGVREYAATVLHGLGYAVLEASDTPSAIELLVNKPPIDLLFTDVVLPGGLNGRTLANEVRRKYPGLPVLFTTGYTRNAIVHQGRLDPDVELLSKPYTEQDLAQKVRKLLDQA